MPIGLTGSPNAFQSLIEHVFVGLTWNMTVPYLEDGMIFPNTPEKQIKRLQQIFQKLHEANLKIYPTKCSFFQKESHFLGPVFSKKGCEADPEKFKAVKKFPILQNQTDARSFIGLCSNYRRYNKNFAIIPQPLNKTIETKSSFTLREDKKEAIESLTIYLSSTPTFAFPHI